MSSCFALKHDTFALAVGANLLYLVAMKERRSLVQDVKPSV